jgi:hypothetical protein
MRKLLLLSLLMTLEVAATRIFYRPLEQVLTPDVGVVYARLAHLSTHHASSSYQVNCRLKEIQILRGARPAAEVVHSFSTLLEHQGVRRSPLRDGSGLETDLREGTHYYFLLDSTGQNLIRVEPESSKERIHLLLDAPSR